MKIYQGDALETLKSLPDNSVHCVITSPPYYGQRDYGNAAQIGLERTPEDYLGALLDVFKEVWRVLIDDGAETTSCPDCCGTGEIEDISTNETSICHYCRGTGYLD